MIIIIIHKLFLSHLHCNVIIAVAAIAAVAFHVFLHCMNIVFVKFFLQVERIMRIIYLIHSSLPSVNLKMAENERKIINLRIKYYEHIP